MHLIAVQLDIVWEDRAANHQRVRKLLQNTAIPSGALIVLPEMFDCGFSMNTSRTAQSEARESEAFLRELARDFDAAVLGGVVGPAAGGGAGVAGKAGKAGKASNLAVAVAPDGAELVRYRKLHPFTLCGEDTHYGAGSRHAIFQWQGIHVAPFICYDLRFPEVFRPAARDGAELFCVIASWPAVRSEHWVRLLQARAIENQAFVLGVNRCGADPNLPYDGRTVAFDSHGAVQFEADGREQVVAVEIDVDRVRQWRAQFPALRDMSC